MSKSYHIHPRNRQTTSDYTVRFSEIDMEVDDMGTATLTSVASICLASFLLIASTGQERKSSRPELRIRVEPDEVEVGKEVIVKLIFRNGL